MTMATLTDEAILLSADKALCQNKTLQLAHDRMLLCTAEPEEEEYRRLWQNYLKAGGDRTMRDNGIDLENWKRLRRFL